MSPVRDVVVVGSGHNALIGACYLARAGLDVEVVERDTVLGGAVSTVERFPGYRIDRGSSVHIMIRHTGIVEELGLAEMGLAYADLDPWAFFPVAGAPGGGIRFAASVPETCASIAAVCGQRDADAYQRFVAVWAARNQAVFAAFERAPTAGGLGRAFLRVGRDPLGGGELSRQFLSAGDSLLDSCFDAEPLKSALSWLGAQSGPPMHEVGTADLVAWNTLLHSRAPGHPMGGSGALTQALARRLGTLGATVRLGDAATRIGRQAGALAVRTAGGEQITARAVLAGCHVLETVALAEDLLGPTLSTRARRVIRVGNGIGVALRVGARALPRYRDAPPDAGTGLTLLAEDRGVLRRAYGSFLAGEIPERPPAVVLAPSALDPSLAPAGRHVVTVWAQWHPYRLARGGWEEHRERETERLLDLVEQAAPGFRDGVEHTFYQSPADLERELGLRAGNVMHVEMGLDSMFLWRPLPELSGYRTPVPGLYLTGASTHPGGGVFGASGRAAAGVLLRDLRRSARGRSGRGRRSPARRGFGAAGGSLLR